MGFASFAKWAGFLDRAFLGLSAELVRALCALGRYDYPSTDYGVFS